MKCSGTARDPAKVEDQVRIPAWTLLIDSACECDGFARQSSKLLDKVRFLGELLPKEKGATHLLTGAGFAGRLADYSTKHAF